MKKVLLTGGSDGLGYAFAKLLLEKGVEVVNLSRSKPDISVTHISTDFSVSDSVTAAIDEIVQNHSVFDAVVHCVGQMQFHEIDEMKFEEINAGFQTNVIGITAFTSGVIGFIKKNEADLVFVSSTVGFKSYKQQGVYTATKRAERGMAQYFQTELQETGCRVISFCPGGMQTKFHEKVTGEKVDTTKYMPVEGVALCMKQLLELPKYMEVSEIVINRKIANLKDIN